MEIVQRRRRTAIAVGGVCAVVMLVYVGSYLILRANHRIRHYSNSRHWVAEKREPEHNFVVTDKAACAVFQPLIRLEIAYHSTVDYCLFY